MTDIKDFSKKVTEARIEIPFDRKDLPNVYDLQAEITDHPIVKDQMGALRYKQTDFDDHDYNALQVDYTHGKITRDEIMQLYRNTGWSLFGFDEVFGVELEVIQLEKSNTRPIEEVLVAWDDAACDNLADCFKSSADELATGGIASLDEVIELLRIAEHFQREKQTTSKFVAPTGFKRGDLVRLIVDFDEPLVNEEGDDIIINKGAVGVVVTVDSPDSEQPITVAWTNLNTINQCNLDEIELYNLNDDFPIDAS